MTQYRKRAVVVEAWQWHKNGDHPQDASYEITPSDGGVPFLSEGKVVRYYRHPEDSGERACTHCDKRMHDHGWIDTVQGGHVVCPGDWIITELDGKGYYPCKPEVFAQTYDEAGTPAPPSTINGALFDFAGYLTTRKPSFPVGSDANAAHVIEHMKAWAAERGHNLDEADVYGWKQQDFMRHIEALIKMAQKDPSALAVNFNQHRVPDRDKNGFLVPGDMTVDVITVIRKTRKGEGG